ncbi:MAG TPA: helix-turn-helix domain-containing protein [Nitrospira sp.]|nr:helix-turn-helix domain-containing protein [Nitrospira sp.]
MNNKRSFPAGNLLLGHLPPREHKQLQTHLELVSVESRQELEEVGGDLRYVCFPIDCAISLMDHQANGQTVEIAVIGKEGSTGFNAAQGLTSSPCRTIVQVGGSMYRLGARWLNASVPFLLQSLIRFGALIFRHSVISVGCSQFHPVDQRLGRWLLAHEHRTGLTTFPFTHEFLAEQLGVQRGTVTEALAVLQKKKLVDAGYGKVKVLKSKALEKVSCDCFQLAKQAIDDYLLDIKAYKRSMA